MPTWTNLYSSEAIYESEVIDISSDFEYYLKEIALSFENNDGVVDVEIRVSHDDEFSWSEWKNINLYLDDLFYIDGVKLNFTKMQYRVIMNIYSRSTSPVFKSFKIDLYGAYKIFNTGDEICKPEIWIKKNGFGDLELINETNGQIMKFKDINDGETIYIDCEKKDIMSDLPLTYRFNNHNGIFLELEIGENIISGFGDYDMIIKCEFKILQ